MGKDAEDVEMKPASAVGVEELDTGYYELIGIVSHKGRTADGGHYVAWTLQEKANGKDLKEDRWLLHDDEDVSLHNWKDIMGLGTDLQGGKPDTQIAYVCFYKKCTVPKDPGHILGSNAEEEKSEEK